MKTKILVTQLAALAVPLLVLLMLCSAAPASVKAQPPPPAPEMSPQGETLGVTTVYTHYSIVISNEPYGFLVDTLIALGHGDETLFEVLTYLKPQSNGAITEAFYNQVAASPPGSSVFVDILGNYAGLQGGIEIGDDGTFSIPDIEAQSYSGLPGYTLIPSLDGVFQSTYALDQAQYIYTHEQNFGVGVIRKYYAFAILWRAPRRSSCRWS